MAELTEEQIQELQTKASRVDELEGKIKEMVPGADLDKVKADLEIAQKDLNPNWQKARQTIDLMRSALKAKGVETDTEGNPISVPQGVNIEEVRKEATAAARGEVLGGRLEELLGEYDDSSATLVRHFYNKLTTGETVTLQNIRSFISQAENAARADSSNQIVRTRKATTHAGGQGPRYSEDNKVDNANVTGLAARMGVKIKGDEQK